MQTILITGAGRGIGLELARQYIAEGGWKVLACCRQPERATELKALQASSRGSLEIHSLEVRDGRQIAALATKLRGTAIDVLLNHAGVYGQRAEALGSIEPDTWRLTLEVNALAPLKICEAFVDHVARSDRRMMAAITSRMGSIADNSSGSHYAYRASKAALNAAMKSLSIDLAGRRIICVVLHPGWVRTAMGGTQAPLSVSESVTGLRKVMAQATLAHSGRFLGYDGAEIPW